MKGSGLGSLTMPKKANLFGMQVEPLPITQIGWLVNQTTLHWLVGKIVSRCYQAMDNGMTCCAAHHTLKYTFNNLLCVKHKLKVRLDIIDLAFKWFMNIRFTSYDLSIENLTIPIMEQVIKKSANY